MLVGMGMMWGESVLDQNFRGHECKAVRSEHKSSKLRGLQYVVTSVAECGDPHFTSCTDLTKELFLEMSIVFVLVREGHKVI